jgi:predicted NBD/HSP70 family sugar kinase/biotin operon repressor
VQRLQTGSLESLRERNRLAVIDTLKQRGTASRAEIARLTGLSRTTVSSIVADLQASGLIVERRGEQGPPNAPQGGRPPILLTLDPSAGAIVGIDFGHDDLRVAVADLSYEVLAERWQKFDVDNDAQGALDAAEQLVRDALEEAHVPFATVVGAGVAMSAPIHRVTGTLGSPAILPGWAAVHPARAMSERLGVSVHVDNDANLGALAEARFGAGRGVGDIAFVMLSSGVGAGLILNGHLYRGSGGTAGEIGHTIVDENGAICHCGNRGCLETQAATPALLEMLRASHGPELSIADLIRLAQDGDAACQRVLADAGRHVGVAIANLVSLFNPRRVIVGGELAAAGDILMRPLSEAVERFAIPAAAREVDVVACELGERAEVLGALALALGESEHVLARTLATAEAGV